MENSAKLESVRRLFSQILEDMETSHKKWDYFIQKIIELTKENKKLEEQLKNKKPKRKN